YGFQANGHAVSEKSATNPLTTYAKANRAAEEGILPLGDGQFCVVAIRQATVFGYSPRMRFDLAINGMTYGAWKTGVLPLMRDGGLPGTGEWGAPRDAADHHSGLVQRADTLARDYQ